MASRKIFNYKSVILESETVEKFGYKPDAWGRTSGKLVVATCRFCGQQMDIRKGFFNKSGSACHKACRIEEQKLHKSPFADPEVRAKSAKTNLERYGVEHASQNKIISNKISATKKTDEYQDKVKDTVREKYGVDNVFQSQEIKSKIEAHNIDKYGKKHHMQNEEVLKRTQETVKDRYGVDNVMKDPIIRQRAAETHLERYGVQSPLQDPSVQRKALSAFNNTVAVDSAGHYKMINILRGTAFWKRLGEENATLKEICKEFNIDYQSATFRLVQDEFRDKYHKTYSFPKQQQQNKIKNIIKGFGLEYTYNDRKIIPPLELDIYIPSCNFAIEFNGSYWHSEAMLEPSIARNKHHGKTKMCSDKDIRLFHIFEHNWIEKEKQITGFIQSCLGINQDKLNARDCIVDESNVKQFIDDNHIQGYGFRTIKYFNLVHNNEVVASMTAASHHRQNIPGNPVVLNRLCFKHGATVRGGSSKLFKRFVEWAKREGYDRIISWSDNSWTQGDIYKILKFKLVQEFGPDYFYWDGKKKDYVSKQSQRKSNTGCPVDMTEREWCIQHGLYRIWDCGKKRWEYEL